MPLCKYLKKKSVKGRIFILCIFFVEFYAHISLRNNFILNDCFFGHVFVRESQWRFGYHKIAEMSQTKRKYEC